MSPHVASQSTAYKHGGLEHVHGLNNEAFVFYSDRVIRLTGAHFIFIDNPVSKAAKLMLMLAHSLTS